MRRPTDNDVPPGWGTDELSKFWDEARSNQFATFMKKRPIYNRLVAIERAFAEVSKGWTNPQSEVSAMLFLRCHSAFRTAAGLAAAGQAVESYVVNRVALEFAAYSLHIFRQPDLAKVWLNRHQGEASMKAAKKAFSHNKVQATVTAANGHAGEQFESLYQRTIDFGGHPNERSVTGNMSVVEEADRRVLESIFLHGDRPALDWALTTTAECGLCALEILQGVFNARFELLGVNAAILALRKALFARARPNARLIRTARHPGQARDPGGGPLS
jgi:hypothetical protein